MALRVGPEEVHHEGFELAPHVAGAAGQAFQLGAVLAFDSQEAPRLLQQDAVPPAMDVQEGKPRPDLIQGGDGTHRVRQLLEDPVVAAFVVDYEPDEVPD